MRAVDVATMPFGSGDVDGGHVELRAESLLEQTILQPPCDVFERRPADRDDFVRERALGQLNRDAGGFAKRDDLGRDPPGTELADHALGADEPRRVRLAERLRQVLVHGVGQPVGRADLFGHVDADASGIPLLDERRQRRRRGEDVVCAGLLDHVAARPERGALDAIAAAIREHVIADAGDVPAPQVLPERVVVVFLHRDDPHVHAVGAHHQRQDLVELVQADLPFHLPSPSRFLAACGGRTDERTAWRRER